ncbi:MAG: hypothetical protein Q8R45_10900 [Brevundimonas sp.]|uniref:hypothetical protein n=2 Tax=Brevundimonas sp. TaxID=1871086 RepID=UPI002723CE44|nr:hypothetical protein [Brevundimonas sp.]MDO9587436.1 hypothetical protein [Brevundimonas sp.]MDP3369811.1 hypothetical protein [Brevundimonas sp.]MDP3657459.1 hypothetical protein [Brevundimonas sp.]
MSEAVEAAVVGRNDRSTRKDNRFFRFLPGFVFILILFIAGQLIFADPRATLFDINGYRLAWVEVLMVAAAIVAMAEQLKVAQPGVNNINEALLIGLVAVVQIVLFTLGAAGVAGFSMFANTEFVLLTLINMAQTVVAFQINAATLMRTISSG